MIPFDHIHNSLGTISIFAQSLRSYGGGRRVQSANRYHVAFQNIGNMGKVVDDWLLHGQQLDTHVDSEDA